MKELYSVFNNSATLDGIRDNGTIKLYNNKLQ